MKRILLLILSLVCFQTFAQNAESELLYEMAQSLFNEGEYDEAVATLDRAVMCSDGKFDINKAKDLKGLINNCQKIYDEAEELYAQKKYDEACSKYRDLQKLNPNNPKLEKIIKECDSAFSSKTPRLKTPSSKKPSSKWWAWLWNPDSYESKPFGIEFGGQLGKNLGAEISVSYKHFLLGVGYNTLNIVNSGYVGNFKKTTNTTLYADDGGFVDLGARFSYFSISCQVGFIPSELFIKNYYEGSGYGLEDGDLDEFWGEYKYKTIQDTYRTDRSTYITLTPMIKGYIPMFTSYGLHFGVGYTFLPTLGRRAGLTGTFGFYVNLP